MLRASEAGPCYGVLMRLLLWGLRGVRGPGRAEAWCEEPALPEFDVAA